MSKENPRDHGYGDSPNPSSPPTILSKADASCPHCGGETLFMLEVLLEDDGGMMSALLAGSGELRGAYLGCAACPYASPMMTGRK